MNKVALVRIIVFLLAWTNQMLAQRGYQPLPILSEETVADLVAWLVSIWVMVKDNTLKKVDKP